MGQTQRIPGIVPKGPVPSLLTVSGPFPAGTNWQSGVAFRQTHLFAGGRWALCPGVDDEKDDPSGGGPADFYPFTGYVAAQCDWLSPDRAEGEYDPEVQAQLDASSAWDLSRELWVGDTNTGGSINPCLQAPFPGAADEFDPTHIINSGTAVNPVDGIGRLLAAYADGTKVGGAVLHIPLRLLTRLVADYTVVLNGAVHTVPGLAVVSGGPGYPGQGTTGPKTAAHTSGAAAGANEEWVFVTGPVETEMSPVRLEPDTPNARWLDRRTNQYYVLAEREMIFRFDPVAVWAALITVPTAS
jgi:hypothetical protein